MAGHSSDMVGPGTVGTATLSWEDMAVTGRLSLAAMGPTVEAHIMRLYPLHPQRRKFLKRCTAGTAAHQSTAPGTSVVDVASQFSDFRNSR